MLQNFSFRVPRENGYWILPPVKTAKPDSCMAASLVTCIEARMRLRKLREGGAFNSRLCYIELHDEFKDTIDNPEVETPKEMLEWVNKNGLSEEPHYRWSRRILKIFRQVPVLPPLHPFNRRSRPLFWSRLLFWHRYARRCRVVNALYRKAMSKYRESPRHRIYKWTEYAPTDVQNIAQELRRHGPLAAGFIQRRDYPFDPGVTTIYKGRRPIMRDPETRQVMAHMVSIVGYGLRGGKIAYWIVMNSYGKKWGAAGFGRMAPHTLDVIFAPRIYRPRKTKKVPNPAWVAPDDDSYKIA